MTRDEYIKLYQELGWHFVPCSGKIPRRKAWNVSLEGWDMRASPNANFGLLHAISETCALDVDNLEATREYIPDIDEILSNNPHITHGDSNKAKVIFHLDTPLQSVRQWDNKGMMVYELRCLDGQAHSVHDVVPPGVHKDGNAIEWVGDPRDIKPLPVDILNLWIRMANEDYRRRDRKGEKFASDIKLTPERINLIRNVLECLPEKIGYNDWVYKVLMPLHSTGDPQAFELAVEYSSRDPEYPGDEVVRNKWASFSLTKNKARTMGSLFSFAQEYGYAGPTLKQKMVSAEEVSKIFEGASTPDQVKVNATNILKIVRNYDRLGNIPELDISIFPAHMADEIIKGAVYTGCGYGAMAGAMFAAISTAFDSRSTIDICGFRTHPIIWASLYGMPGSGKTPAIVRFVSQIDRYETEIFDLEEMDRQFQIASTDYKKNLSEINKLEKKGADATYLKNINIEPEDPANKRRVLNDASTQMLLTSMAYNPPGIILVKDEARSWLRRITKRDTYEDTAMLFAGYSGHPYRSRFVSRGNLQAESCNLTIISSMQPDMLDDIKHEVMSDGFLQRFSFFHSVSVDGKTRKGDHRPSEWFKTLVKDGYASEPKEYTCVDSGFQAYESWVKKSMTITSDLNVRAFQSWLSKTPEMLARYTLLMHFASGGKDVTEISRTTFDRAMKLMKSYLIPVAKAVFDVTGLEYSSAEINILKEIVRECDSPKIRIETIMANLGLRDRNPVVKMMSEMTKMGLLTEKTDDHGRHVRFIPTDYFAQKSEYTRDVLARRRDIS